MNTDTTQSMLIEFVIDGMHYVKKANSIYGPGPRCRIVLQFEPRPNILSFF